MEDPGFTEPRDARVAVPVGHKHVPAVPELHGSRRLAKVLLAAPRNALLAEF